MTDRGHIVEVRQLERLMPAHASGVPHLRLCVRCCLVGSSPPGCSVSNCGIQLCHVQHSVSLLQVEVQVVHERSVDGQARHPLLAGIHREGMLALLQENGVLAKVPTSTQPRELHGAGRIALADHARALLQNVPLLFFALLVLVEHSLAWSEGDVPIRIPGEFLSLEVEERCQQRNLAQQVAPLLDRSLAETETLFEVLLRDHEDFRVLRRMHRPDAARVVQQRQLSKALA
mmetsp:Transcript_20329/g.54307  ORF Transcript_20329/g.54307 Transcript_20329/m.54307 type:complete len:231 (+) Transcript_20329:1053-1745(+)